MKPGQDPLELIFSAAIVKGSCFREPPDRWQRIVCREFVNREGFRFTPADVWVTLKRNNIVPRTRVDNEMFTFLRVLRDAGYVTLTEIVTTGRVLSVTVVTPVPASTVTRNVAPPPEPFTPRVGAALKGAKGESELLTVTPGEGGAATGIGTQQRDQVRGVAVSHPLPLDHLAEGDRVMWREQLVAGLTQIAVVNGGFKIGDMFTVCAENNIVLSSHKHWVEDMFTILVQHWEEIGFVTVTYGQAAQRGRFGYATFT